MVVQAKKTAALEEKTKNLDNAVTGQDKTVAKLMGKVEKMEKDSAQCDADMQALNKTVQKLDGMFKGWVSEGMGRWGSERTRGEGGEGGLLADLRSKVDAFEEGAAQCEADT